MPKFDLQIRVTKLRDRDSYYGLNLVVAAILGEIIPDELLAHVGALGIFSVEGAKFLSLLGPFASAPLTPVRCSVSITTAHEGLAKGFGNIKKARKVRWIQSPQL